MYFLYASVYSLGFILLFIFYFVHIVYPINASDLDDKFIMYITMIYYIKKIIKIQSEILFCEFGTENK